MAGEVGGGGAVRVTVDHCKPGDRQAFCCGRPVGFPHDFRCWHERPAPMVAAALGYVDELIFGLMQWRSAEPALFAPLTVPIKPSARAVSIQHQTEGIELDADDNSGPGQALAS